MGLFNFWSRAKPQPQQEIRVPARPPASVQPSGRTAGSAPAQRPTPSNTRPVNSSASPAAKPTQPTHKERQPAEVALYTSKLEEAQAAPVVDEPVAPKKAPNVLSKKDDIPHHVSVMSVAGGTFPLEGDLQKNYAILLISRERKDVYLVVSTDIDQTKIDDDYFAITERLHRQGYSRKKILANPEILSIIYEESTATKSTEDQQRQATTIQLDFDDLLRQADEAGASDIHIEVRRTEARVRFRKDGNLYEHRSWPVRYARMISSVIYQVIADEKDTTFDEAKPQDAIIDRELSETLRLRVRLATLPAYPAGFDMIMRLLKMGQDGKRVSLDKLGYEKVHLSKIRRAVDKPVGAVIMAGTTGSGKSTSLNSMVGEKIENNKGRIKVITVEDPPEYLLIGATQVPVVRSRSQAKAGDHQVNPFAAVVRAAMRSDPDLLLVGEVRDEASAELLKHAVQSGHQVFTTVHASGGIDIVARLRSNGVTDDVLGGQNFITALIYQTLLQKLCPVCSFGLEVLQAEAESDLAWEFVERVYRYMPHALREKLRFTNESGCSNCTGGLIGRSVASEVILPDTYMLKCFRERQDSDALMHYRRRGGKIALEHGILKALRGETDLRDVEKKLDQITALEELDSSVRTNFKLPLIIDYQINEDVFEEVVIGEDPNQVIVPKRVLLDQYGKPLVRPGTTAPIVLDPAPVAEVAPAPAPMVVEVAAAPAVDTQGANLTPADESSLLGLFSEQKIKEEPLLAPAEALSSQEPSDVVVLAKTATPSDVPSQVDAEPVTEAIVVESVPEVALPLVVAPDDVQTVAELPAPVVVAEPPADAATDLGIVLALPEVKVAESFEAETKEAEVIRLVPRKAELILQEVDTAQVEPAPEVAPEAGPEVVVEPVVEVALNPLSIELIRLLQRQVLRSTPALNESGVADKICKQLNRNLTSMAKIQNGFELHSIERIASIVKSLDEAQLAALKIATPEAVLPHLLPVEQVIAAFNTTRLEVDGLKSQLMSKQNRPKEKAGNVRSMAGKAKKGSSNPKISVKVKRLSEDKGGAVGQQDGDSSVTAENNNNNEGG
jgi:type II secretory ATPase GspE/PulE/Tfp pilus assembly ATPase PilB-like protein